MTIEFNDQLIIEGVARAAERILHSEAFIERIADAIALRFEILTPAETAALLSITTRTLGENHVEWELDKSVALGEQLPKYLLSQVIERLKAKKINGSKAAPKKSAAAKTQELIAA